MSIANLFVPNPYDIYANSITPTTIKDSVGNVGGSGKMLSSNGTNLTWSNVAVDMNNISGMSISSPQNNQILQYNGSNFINNNLQDQISYNSAIILVGGSYIGQSGLLSSYNGACTLTNNAITITKIGAHLSTDPLVGSVIFTLYVNGVATALNTTISAGSVSNSSTGSINISAGSTYAIRCSVIGLATLSIAQVALNYIN